MKLTWLFIVGLTILTACDSVEIRKEYYSNGALKSEFEVMNNLKNGYELKYDSLGNLVTRQFYKNDTLDGLKTTYFPFGKISEIVNYKRGKEQGDFFKFFSNGNIGYNVTMEEGKMVGLFQVYDRYDSGRMVDEVYLVNWNNDVFKYYIKKIEKSGESNFEYKPLNLLLPEEKGLQENKFAEFEFNETKKYDSALLVVEFSKDRINRQTDLDTVFMKQPKIRYQLTSSDTGTYFLRGFIIGCNTIKNEDESDSLLYTTYSTYFAFEEKVRVNK